MPVCLPAAVSPGTRTESEKPEPTRAATGSDGAVVLKTIPPLLARSARLNPVVAPAADRLVSIGCHVPEESL